MTSYVVIYGQPVVTDDPPDAQAVLIVEGPDYVCVSPDDTWVARIKDINRGRPPDLADQQLIEYTVRSLRYYRIGSITPLDSPLDEAADVLERLYFS